MLSGFAHRRSHWGSQWLRPATAALLAVALAVAAPVMTQASGSKMAGPKVPKADMPRAEKHELKHEIDLLEENWRTAALRRDAAAMAGLLSEDYIGITAGGTLQSKDETVASLRTGATRFTRIDLSDRKVRFYGNTAVVTSQALVEGSSPSGAINGSYRYTRVYVRDSKGAWKVVSFESSRIKAGNRD